ncbi:MAG: HEPN domain-containing protein [Bdellovibrionaceae bacterium]|nr:HEPN domain-containing protein [Pseudobdellovibrionaceae bacterium]
MANQKMVKYWFTYASRNLKIAKHSLALGSEYKEILGFHSQQCAEMAIKGLMAFHRIRIVKTHDLKMLAVEVEKIYPSLSSLIIKSAKPMTDLAVAYRYPDAELPPLTVRKAQSAIESAEKIYQACLKLIPR